MAAYPKLAEARPSVEYLFNILTGRQEAELNLALHHGWNVQGLLMSVVVPVGGVSAKGFIDKAPPAGLTRVPDETVITALEALLDLSGDREAEATCTLKAKGAIGDVIGPALLPELAKLILPALFEWLQNWLLNPATFQELLQRLFGDKQPAPQPA